MDIEIEKYELMKKLQNKLNGELGDLWWNRYVGGAFWSNISTPLNLAITLLSAVTAGQATTQNMLEPSMFFKVSVASLLLSTLNTFFRPHTQLMENMTAIKTINELGARFETIYYSENSTVADFTRRYNEYKKLSQDFNKYQIAQTPEQQNFLTDLIYWLFKKYSCLKNSYRWLDVDMLYIQEPKSKRNESTLSTLSTLSCCGTDTNNLQDLEANKYNKDEQSEKFFMSVDDIEPKLNDIDPKLNDIDPKLNDIEPKLNDIDPKLNDIEEK